MLKSLNKLDWLRILNHLNNFLYSDFSKERCQNLVPFFSYEEAIKAQEKTKFIWDLLEKGEKLELNFLKSLKNLFEKASKRGFFLPIELSEIKKWFLTLEKLIPYLENSPFSHLKTLYEEIKEIDLYLNRVLDWEKAEIKDRASYNLFIIRKKLKEAKEILLNRLEKIRENLFKKGYLQENLFTQKEGRYVLPVKVEYKNKVKGILHEISQSGATVFIEPASIISLSNEIENLRHIEQREIVKILKEVSQEIFSRSYSFFNLEDSYADFEITFAKASLGKTYKGKFPLLKKEGSIKIRSGIHPLLLLKESSTSKAVFNDFIIEKGLLISGPNLGGKTVSLKTIGILTLMGQSGFPIPAEEAEIPLFSKIFVDLGDDQDIIEGESSFSSHLKNLKEILDKADETTLVLLDEPGKGTNPEEGIALVVAIINELLKRKTKVIVTTHSQFLKTLSLKMKDLKLATMEYDLETKEPTYKIIYNVWGESLAFDLAKKIGFSEEILSEAISYLKNREYWEWYKIVEKERKKLKELEEEFNLKLKNLESKERELEEKKKELKNLYEKKIEELISIWNEEFKKIIEGIKKGSTGYRKAIQNFEDFVNKFLESSAREEEIKEGDKVFVLPFKKEGKVLKVKDKMVEVKLGNFKIEVPKGNIIKDYSEMKQPPFKYFKPKDLEDFQKFYEKIEKKEILKLMGLTVEEALEEIEKTLNKAFLEGASKVYLIHGHGTGRLRESVREYLKNHPLVKNFKFADPMEGGTGVTIVYLEEKN
uniref:Endonuclease MutS2 n=1 Tax=Thermodesulfobacterium geofontis TaxID=1295609 RepID=A0A7V6CEC5_9BACT